MNNTPLSWRRFAWAKPLAILSIGILAVAFTPRVSGGLINVNFTDTSPSDVFFDGPGPLGAGIWNRIIDGDAAGTNDLFDNLSQATNVSISQSSGTPVVGRSQGNGNPVQNESWFDAGSFIITITGLPAFQVFKVAVYSDRVGSGSPDIFVVNGTGKSLPSPGADPTTLPGAANVDYAIFTVAASGSGRILINVPESIAGLQIQGVLSGEDGPQADCLITKNANSSGGKSDNFYGVRSKKAQTLARKVKGSKNAKFYINVQNDGTEIDNFYLMGFWKERQFKKVRVRDRRTGANITSAVLAQRYRFINDVGQTASFFVKAKRAKQRNGNTSLQICASPSTLKRSKQDCVTALLKSKR